MMLFPKMPSAGTSKIGGLYDTVRDIVKLLPKLAVVGDNKTTFVEHSPHGTMIRAKSMLQGGVSAGSSKAYDGHFNVYVSKDSQDKDFIHITGGYFSVNGLVRSIAATKMLASEVITNNSIIFYAVLEIAYEKDTNRWTPGAFNFYRESDLISAPAYKCKFPIGEVRFVDGSYQAKCYEIQFPVLIVGGDCTV